VANNHPQVADDPTTTLTTFLGEFKKSFLTTHTSKQHDIKHALNAAEQTPLNNIEYYELRNGTQTGSNNIKSKYSFS